MAGLEELAAVTHSNTATSIKAQVMETNAALSRLRQQRRTNRELEQRVGAIETKALQIEKRKEELTKSQKIRQELDEQNKIILQKWMEEKDEETRRL